MKMTSTSQFTQSLLGTWILVEFTMTDPVNRLNTYPMGSDPHGVLIYSSDGYVSAQIMRRDLSEYLHADATKDDLSVALGRFLAYAGQFEVCEGSEKFHLKHMLRVCSYPHWIGQVQERVAELNGDYLMLSSDGPLLSTVFPPLVCRSSFYFLFHD